MSASAALWATILALGLYHGLNPAMGWPIAVARGLEQRRAAAVFGTLLPLGAGHFAAMAVVLVPLAWLSWVLAWSRPIRLVAGTVVLLFGVYKLLRPRHPRALARIRPGQLAWWSFLMATAHGAGLMLVPFMLGLCSEDDMFTSLARSDVATALAVAVAHTLAMVLGGLGMAWVVYRYLGLQFLRRAWFNLDAAWAASLVLAGGAGVAMAL
ncbi:hypothetical protein [Ramlibacter agri]|uniref:hypothetical protein n=1 Tax=Ramlibacter agri TaxID=2728837 RepID=UPI001980BB03|nr:hypothetical protein [Ramlibacter agri]